MTKLWLGVGSEKLGSGEFRIGRVEIEELALRGLRSRVGIRGTGVEEVGVGEVVVGVSRAGVEEVGVGGSTLPQILYTPHAPPISAIMSISPISHLQTANCMQTCCRTEMKSK